jgi:hypothetical protein
MYILGVTGGRPRGESLDTQMDKNTHSKVRKSASYDIDDVPGTLRKSGIHICIFVYIYIYIYLFIYLYVYKYI